MECEAGIETLSREAQETFDGFGSGIVEERHGERAVIGCHDDVLKRLNVHLGWPGGTARREYFDHQRSSHKLASPAPLGHREQHISPRLVHLFVQRTKLHRRRPASGDIDRSLGGKLRAVETRHYQRDGGVGLDLNRDWLARREIEF
jgi:hypothetical protein